ncbi:MAG: hypothetical protein AAGD11_06485 [Planctomycetota bacterium]
MPLDEAALKLEPRYGYYPWWPEDGDDWLHPEDIERARQTIPSYRVFRRDGEVGPFVMLYYGKLQLRVRRTLWQEVETEGFELGDWVEVLSRLGQNEFRTGTIREMIWDAHAGALRYQILDNGRPIPNLYSADDLRHVDPTEQLPGG